MLILAEAYRETYPLFYWVVLALFGACLSALIIIFTSAVIMKEDWSKIHEKIEKEKDD